MPSLLRLVLALSTLGPFSPTSTALPCRLHLALPAVATVHTLSCPPRRPLARLCLPPPAALDRRSLLCRTDARYPGSAYVPKRSAALETLVRLNCLTSHFALPLWLQTRCGYKTLHQRLDARFLIYARSALHEGPRDRLLHESRTCQSANRPLCHPEPPRTLPSTLLRPLQCPCARAQSATSTCTATSMSASPRPGTGASSRWRRRG